MRASMFGIRDANAHDVGRAEAMTEARSCQPPTAVVGAFIVGSVLYGLLCLVFLGN